MSQRTHLRLAIALGIMLPMCATSTTPTSAAWPAVQETNLEVTAGSALDFTAFNQLSPIVESSRLTSDANGNLITAQAPTKPLRFLVAALGHTNVTGGLPDKAETDRVIQQLVRRGYNMVRLDFIEDTLMEGQVKDFDFNPTQLDRFFYLVSKLKQAGIYMMLNIQSSSNGGFGTGNATPRWKTKHGLVARNYYDPTAQAHWKELVDAIFLKVNPYTNSSLLADPTIAILCLVNESGPNFIFRKSAPQALLPAYIAWLQQRYSTIENLRKAWNIKDHANQLHSWSEIEFPNPNDPPSAKMGDLQRFYFELEGRTAAWMTGHLRLRGYRGIVTAYNNWLSPASHASRAQFELVDIHHYNGEPDAWVQPGSRMKQDSVVGSGASYIQDIAATRHWGKPFTVSEYGQVFWNKYRRESALLVPAYASFQNWSAICQHSFAISLQYDPIKPGRTKAIHPFMVGLDPIGRATEVLAALLYRRGDVSAAKGKVTIPLEPSFVFDETAQMWGMPDDIRKIGLITGLGLKWNPRAHPTEHNSDETQIKPSFLTASWAGHVANVAAKKLGALGRFGEHLDLLKRKGFLTKANATNPLLGTYQSDTEQLSLNTFSKTFRVLTPLTEAVAFDSPESIELSSLKIDAQTGPAAVSLSSLDGQLINKSTRLLVSIITDARNTGMTFSDDDETTLEKLGTLPARIQPIELTLRLRTLRKDLQAYALAMNGQRLSTLVSQYTDGFLVLHVNTAKHSVSPIQYIELSSPH